MVFVAFIFYILWLAVLTMAPIFWGAPLSFQYCIIVIVSYSPIIYFIVKFIKEIVYKRNHERVVNAEIQRMVKEVESAIRAADNNPKLIKEIPLSQEYIAFCNTSYSHKEQEAIEIVKRMLECNDPCAGKACGNLAWDMKDKNPQMAESYAQKGCKLGDTSSMEFLADMFYDCGNYSLAYDYFLRAISNGAYVGVNKKRFAWGNSNLESCYYITHVAEQIASRTH